MHKYARIVTNIIPNMKNKLYQKDIILKFLRSKDDWVVSWQLEKVDTPWGWLGTASLKRCRELQRAGQVEKKMMDGYVWYRSPAPKEVKEYRVQGELVGTENIY